MKPAEIPGALETVERHWYDLAVLTELQSHLCERARETGTLPREDYRFIHKSLRRAEAFARRILVLLALSFTLPTLRPRTTPRKPTSATPPETRRVSAKRRPFFSLLDPLVCPERTQHKLRRPHGAARPRLRVPEAPTALEPQPEPKPDARPAAPLLARLDALKDVLDNPGHHTARMARWLARTHAAAQSRETLPPRTRPIRWGNAPEAARYQGDEDSYWAYVALTNAVHEALDYYDTS